MTRLVIAGSAIVLTCAAFLLYPPSGGGPPPPVGSLGPSVIVLNKFLVVLD